jgi:hypothetical protein
MKEIGRGINKREHFADLYEWEKIQGIWDTGARSVAVDFESSKQQGTKDLSQSSFVNWIWSFGQTFLPAVYWRHPHINVFSKKPKWHSNTSFVESTINNYLELTKFRKHCLRALCDLLCYGHGWIKLGWYTQFGQVPTGVTGGEVGTKGRSMTDLNMDLRMHAPYAIRVQPTRIVFDPEAPTYEDLRWIAEESYIPYESAKKDPYLKHTRDLAPMVYKNEREDSFLPVQTANEYETKENKWCRRWEIWDREERTVRVILQGSLKWNREVDWPYAGIDGFPYKMLVVTDAIKDIYPVSPVLPWLPLVEELAFIRSIRMEHLQKMGNKALVPPGVLDEDGMRDLLDPATDVVQCQDDPQRIQTTTFMKPDANLYASEDSVKSDIREISGFSEILSGQIPFSRIAATTSAIMERNSTLRFDHYSERVADFIIQSSKDLFKICRQYQTYPQQVEVTGQPDPEWIEISKRQLDGDFMFKLDIEDLSVSSRQQKTKEAYDALITLSQFPEIKRRSLIRDFLMALGKGDLQDYMNPPQGPPLDPMYENQMMMRGIPVQPNPEEDFAMHLQIHAQVMESPQFQQLTARDPAIGTLFREHVQATNRMAQVQQMMGPPVGTKAAQQGLSPNQSMQQGQASATSQPPGGTGPQNQGGDQALMGAIQSAMRR